MDKLPEDLVYEILLRCPTKAVERCVAAFPAYTAVVRRPSFSQDFYLRQQDRVLFATRIKNTRWNFKSSSIAEQESSILLSTTTLPLHDYRQNRFMNYSSGLLCSGFGENPIIFNPTNGLHRVLPGVIFGGKKEVARCFLGFSHVSGFNVIAVVKDACQMLALGDTPMAWKPIRCNHLPRPETASVCIEGSIYYAAYETPRTMVLIIFNLETELFRIVKIPQSPKHGALFCEKILNVDGKVGVSFVAADGNHEVKILENPYEELWSTRMIETPPSLMNDIQPFGLLSFEGFTCLGETIFSQDVSSSKVLYYCNVVNDSYRKQVHVLLDRQSSQTLTFWQHVDCTMFT